MTKAKKPDVWMPWYVGDFLVDTADLEAEATGAYALLLMHSWVRGGQLPDDDDKLGRFARCEKRRWLVVKNDVAQFFEIADGKWTQKRLVEEFIKANSVYASKVANGRKGGRPVKPNVTETKPAGLADGKLDETQPQPQEPTTSISPDGDMARKLTKDEVWRLGKEMLVTQKMSVANAGTFVGYLCKTFGEEQTLGAFQAALGEQPADLRSWLMGRLKPKSAGRQQQRGATINGILGDGNERRLEGDATARDITGESRRVA